MDLYSVDSDRSLMKKLSTGQIDSFDLLYERYSSNLYSFSRSLLKTHEDAEGVVEEVLLRVWKKSSELLEQKSFRVFLFRLAYSAIVDHFRKHNNQLLVSYKPDKYQKATYDVLSNVQVSLKE